MNIKMHRKKNIILLAIGLILSCIFFLRGASAFTTITVMPGKVNAFRIVSPKTVRAGRKFYVKLVALDDYGNIITNFANTYEGLNVQVSIGDNSIKHIAVPASEFKNGIVKVILNYKKAGLINLSASFQGVSNNALPIRVIPGPFHNLKIETPRTVIAGDSFGVKVYATDQYGNHVHSMPTANIKIYLTGDNFKIHPRTISSNYIKNGFGRFSFISDRAGVGQLNFEFNYGGKTHVFNSKDLNIVPAGFNKFQISTNISKVPAGKPFIIKIVPVDRFGNVIQSINKMKGRVKLILLSKNGIERSSIFGFNSFNHGVALVRTVFNRVGTFSIYAKPIGILSKNFKQSKSKLNNKISPKSLLLYK